LQVGWISENWRPSDGAASSDRTNAYSTWVADATNPAAPTKWTENADGTVNATWTIEIDQETLTAKQLEGAQLAVFSVAAGGDVRASNEQAVAIAFAEPAVPTLSVSKTEALDPDGETITITAEN